MLVMNRRRRACEVVDLIGFYFEWIGYIVTDEFEVIVPQQMTDVLFVAGEKVVEADDFVTLLDEFITKMAAEESGSSCY